MNVHEIIEEHVKQMRETVGVGRCPTCGERAAPEHSDEAKGGSVCAGCPNGHHWTVSLS